VPDWNACARKLDECEKLRVQLQSLEQAFRRRAERARDEGDIGTMVAMRDAARAAGIIKGEMGALAGDLDSELSRARQDPSGAGLQPLLDRLEATAGKWRELATVYEPFIAWEAEPS
jgi:hypothetical protein